MRRRDRAVRVAAAALGVGAILTGLAGVAAAATGFAPVPEAGAPGLLRLQTSPEQLSFRGLSAGQTAYGQIRVDLERASWGDIAMEMRVSGELASAPNGIAVAVQACDVPWSAVPDDPAAEAIPVCRHGRMDIARAEPGDDFSGSSPVWDLGRMTADRHLFLLVTVEMPDDSWDESLMGLEADFALLVTAEGDEDGQAGIVLPGAVPPRAGAGDPPSGPSRELARTGTSVAAMALIAGGALLLGATLRRRTR